MSYFYSKELKNITFDRAVERIKAELEKEGFGILSTIDMKEKFREKLTVEFKRYTILGACNPPLAYEILQKEDKLGLMMPCNVVVQENDSNGIEVSVIDPKVAIMMTGNETIADSIDKVRIKFQNVIERL